jgi:ferrochelatase
VFDALLVLSFGGPEGPDDVLPFLRNVTRGRNVPDERLVEVAAQYDRFGGVSPINDQCRALVAALRDEFAAHDVDLPVYWGNRNWEPYLADTVATMAADGIRHALVFVTSAFGSYSGCRQYREDLARAAESVGPSAPTLDKLRLYHNHPGFLEPAAANVADALARFDRPPRLVFTAHSIPLSMATVCDYESQLRGAATIIVEMVGHEGDWDLVYQSRSGPPQVPWLEPDVGDHLRSLAAEGVTDVVLCPLGFTSDHMEVLYDLDTLAAAGAAEVGIRLERATTVGTAPRFVSMIRELVEERRADAPRLFLGNAGPWPDRCPEGHCLAPPSAPRGRPGPAV